MLRYARSCCVADLTITLHVAWYDCRWFIFSAPYLRVLRVFLFEVCMLCFIVTFHVTTLDKGNRPVQIKHIGFVLATGSTNACLSVHSVLNSRFSESTFHFLSSLLHAMVCV